MKTNGGSKSCMEFLGLSMDCLMKFGKEIGAGDV